MSSVTSKEILLKDGTCLIYYFGQDSHGTNIENYTYVDSKGMFLKMFIETNNNKTKELQTLLKSRI